MNNYLKTKFSAKSINESLARIIVSGFIMPLDPTIETLSEIKTAVSEAVTNAIIHGYEGGEGIVEMELILEENNLTVKVSDKGVGILDINRAREPLYTSKPECDRSGMGFTVMESFMDTLHIISHCGQGTTVVMTKKF